LIERESTPFNRKLLVNLLMWAWLIILFVFKGNGRTESVVGVKKCDEIDWTIFGIFFAGAFIFLIIGALMNRHEQRQKEKLGYTFTAGDIDWTPKTITRISLLSILSGFCATGCGLGSPPLIYNQFLDPYKTPPPVI